jgi:beta-glucosidase/6-phospho-beta-glucosidase/beta-galactosidase
VEPEDGKWDEAAWGRYVEWMHLLTRNGITPMVTLLHYTLPVWMADRGGLTAREFPERFAHFAGEAAMRLGSDVHLWCTILSHGYGNPGNGEGVYLGHLSKEETYWYLTATPELLTAAGEAFRRSCEPGGGS